MLAVVGGVIRRSRPAMSYWRGGPPLRTWHVQLRPVDMHLLRSERRGAELSSPSRKRTLPALGVGLADLQLGPLMKFVVGHELDPHAPAAERPDHRHELAQGEVAPVDRDERLVYVRRNGGVGDNLTAEDVPPRRPLVPTLEELDLGLPDGDLGGREVQALAVGLTGLDALVPVVEQLDVRHGRELLGADLQVRRRHRRVGVLDDGVVAVPGDANLVGGCHVGRLGSGMTRDDTRARLMGNGRAQGVWFVPRYAFEESSGCNAVA